MVCGDTGVSIEFGDAIDPAINAGVRRLFLALKSSRPVGVVDLIPTYRSLFIQYDPWRCSFERLLLLVEGAMREGPDLPASDGLVVEIPVCYGNQHGPDLDELAGFQQLSAEEVIRIHSRPVYTVYMIGFTPGFPYLGGLDERLATPRRKEPRRKVPAGSVGIADRQTGIYPLESPGGWQIIGRTPVRLFDLNRPEPFLLSPGDRVRFVPITEDAFERH
ncbi:MAG TPA: allophanate hydrolase [Syntrophobacteraceae bacterium]|nr:allophanate hydrolase [Syntrophobacteraceae bacterium]